MGRSVEVPSNASTITYRTLDYGGYCEPCEMLTHSGDNNACPECGAELSPDDSGDFSTMEFEHTVDWIREAITAKFPSFSACNRWLDYPYRETQVIATNYLCDISISEYCGMVAISVIPTGSDDCSENTTGIAQHWCDANAGPFMQEMFGEYVREGSMSNGETVYTCKA